MSVARLIFLLDLLTVVAYACIATSSPEGLVTTTTPTTTTTTRICPPGADGAAYEYFATTGYCYSVKAAGPLDGGLLGLLKTQPQARANCVADGGDLASIESAAENQFLFGLSEVTGNLFIQVLGLALQPWIGLEQVGDGPIIPIPGFCPASVTFQWTDTMPVNYGPNWLAPLGVPVMPACGLQAATGCTQLVATPLPLPVPPTFVPQGEWYQSPCLSLVAGRWICKKPL